MAPHLHFPDKLEKFSDNEDLWRPVADRQYFTDSLQGNRWKELYSDYFDKLRTAIRRKHYSIRTEQSYEQWVARFLTFHDMKDPVLLCAKNVAEYLDYLANERRVAASTQNQAL